MTSNVRTLDGDRSSNMEAIIYFNTIKWLPTYEKELFEVTGLITELGEVKLDSLQRMMHLEDVGGELPEQSLLCGGHWAAPSVYPTFSKLLGFASILFLFFPPAQNELLETFVRISVN